MSRATRACTPNYKIDGTARCRLPVCLRVSLSLSPCLPLTVSLSVCVRASAAVDVPLIYGARDINVANTCT